MPPVRLLVVSNMYPGPRAPYYGAFVASHVEALRRDPRFVVELLCINNQDKGLWHTSVKYGRMFAKLAQRLCFFRPDVVHYHYALPTAVFAPFASRVGHPPYVVTLHGGDFHQTRRRLPAGDWLMRKVLSRAHALIAVSASLAADVERFLPLVHPPLSVINMGVDVSRFSLQEPAPLSRLAFVGQLILRKGADLAIRAVASARRLCPDLCSDLTLTVIGDGAERRNLTDLAENLGVHGTVTFLGGLSPDKVPAALSGHGVLLVPSREEPLGLVALEGMAAGLIVVAARVGGLVEIVQESESGMLVPPDNPEALATRLVELQRMSRTARDELRSSARRFAEGHAIEKKVAEVAEVLLLAATHPA